MAAAPPSHERPPDPNRWWTLAVVCVATFMLLLDITIVNTALPVIQRDLGASFEDLQWVVDAYALTLAALMLTAGALADRFGRRLIFVGGVGLFAAASLLCGLSSSPASLNVARGLQGVGGAAMFATSLALLAATFTGRERGTALGIWGAVTGASVAVGPLAGGALVEHVSWQSIFYINVPIGLATIAVALRKAHESRDPDAAHVDWAGLVTFSAALFLLVYGLVRGNGEGWGSATIVGALAGAGALLVLFLVAEARRSRPMLDLALFRKPAFAGVSIVAFALSAAMFSMFLYLTLYLQNVLGYSPLEAGLRFLPVTVMSFVCAAASGNLTERMPTRLLLGAGLALVAAGLLLMARVDARSGWGTLLPGFLVAGAGVGLANPAIASTAVGVVDPRRAGMAAGINNTFRQVGIATGVAGLGALFQSRVLEGIREQVGGAVRLPPAEALVQGHAAGLAGRAHEAFLTAWTGALHDILLVGAGVAFTGAIAAVALVRPQDFVARGAPPAGVGRQPAAPARTSP